MNQQLNRSNHKKGILPLVLWWSLFFGSSSAFWNNENIVFGDDIHPIRNCISRNLDDKNPAPLYDEYGRIITFVRSMMQDRIIILENNLHTIKAEWHSEQWYKVMVLQWIMRSLNWTYEVKNDRIIAQYSTNFKQIGWETATWYLSTTNTSLTCQEWVKDFVSKFSSYEKKLITNVFIDLINAQLTENKSNLDTIQLHKLKKQLIDISKKILALWSLDKIETYLSDTMWEIYYAYWLDNDKSDYSTMRIFSIRENIIQLFDSIAKSVKNGDKIVSIDSFSVDVNPKKVLTRFRDFVRYFTWGPESNDQPVLSAEVQPWINTASNTQSEKVQDDPGSDSNDKNPPQQIISGTNQWIEDIKPLVKKFIDQKRDSARKYNCNNIKSEDNENLCEAIDRLLDIFFDRVNNTINLNNVVHYSELTPLKTQPSDYSSPSKQLVLAQTIFNSIVDSLINEFNLVAEREKERKKEQEVILADPSKPRTEMERRKDILEAKLKKEKEEVAERRKVLAQLRNVIAKFRKHWGFKYRSEVVKLAELYFKLWKYDERARKEVASWSSSRIQWSWFAIDFVNIMGKKWFKFEPVHSKPILEKWAAVVHYRTRLMRYEVELISSCVTSWTRSYKDHERVKREYWARAASEWSHHNVWNALDWDCEEDRRDKMWPIYMSVGWLSQTYDWEWWHTEPKRLTVAFLNNWKHVSQIAHALDKIPLKQLLAGGSTWTQDWKLIKKGLQVAKK